jgi:DNA primase large subunit
LRKWFLQQETRFFQMRIRMLADDEVKQMLSKNLDIHYEALKDTDDDWVKFSDNIKFNADKDNQRPGQFLRVPFKEALSLVGKRSVFLHKGIAYVPINQLQSIACSHFRQKLSHELIKAYKYLPTILKDSRI